MRPARVEYPAAAPLGLGVACGLVLGLLGAAGPVRAEPGTPAEPAARQDKPSPSMLSEGDQASAVEPTEAAADARATSSPPSAVPPAWLAQMADERPVTDDVVLLEMLTEAIELRRREDFDRTLDARDPGELIEHATLQEHHFDHRSLDIESLFIVGDELFAYLFRPENGWGGARSRRKDPSYTPTLRRIHLGRSGGPDAFACANCHSKGGPDGSGTQTQNAFLRGDGEGTPGADQRNPPHVLGLGPVELLAREMSAQLRAQADAASQRAAETGDQVEQPLAAKGVSFGTIVAFEDGSFDSEAVEGVDVDLVVKPFGWKGHQASLRGMIEESLQIHQGLISKRIHLAVRDDGLDPVPYGRGPWHDLDDDGVSLEIDDGMLTTVVGYLAQLEVPVVRPPRDPGLLDLFAQGRGLFGEIGCASCHVPALTLVDPKLELTAGSAESDLEPFVIDVARDGEAPKVEPITAGPNPQYLVHLFSDLKRHDMGQSLASPAPEGLIHARAFLTRPLWGLAETAPYLHDGRAPTVHDAIVLHDGEGAAARDAYVALDEIERAALRVFLTSLSRQPKLFVP